MCGQSVGRNAALPNYLCCTLSLHCTSECIVLLGSQCARQGSVLCTEECVHSARRPAVRSRLAEGSGVRALLWAAGEGKVETRGGAGTPDHH